MFLQQLSDPDADLSTANIVTTFQDGTDRVSATALIINDDDPEGNETFILTISELVPRTAQIGVLSSMRLVIRANDQPNGILQFDLVRF